MITVKLVSTRKEKVQTLDRIHGEKEWLRHQITHSLAFGFDD